MPTILMSQHMWSSITIIRICLASRVPSTSLAVSALTVLFKHSSGLVYESQFSALNEHCADVFSSLLEQYVLRQTAEEVHWLLAQDMLFTE